MQHAFKSLWEGGYILIPLDSARNRVEALLSSIPRLFNGMGRMSRMEPYSNDWFVNRPRRTQRITQGGMAGARQVFENMGQPAQYVRPFVCGIGRA